jgi:hypothetical protein
MGQGLAADGATAADRGGRRIPPNSYPFRSNFDFKNGRFLGRGVFTTNAQELPSDVLSNRDIFALGANARWV